MGIKVISLDTLDDLKEMVKKTQSEAREPEPAAKEAEPEYVRMVRSAFTKGSWGEYKKPLREILEIILTQMAGHPVSLETPKAKGQPWPKFSLVRIDRPVAGWSVGTLVLVYTKKDREGILATGEKRSNIPASGVMATDAEIDDFFELLDARALPVDSVLRYFA